LVKDLTQQVSVLVRNELKLAQAAVTRKGKQAGVGIGMLGRAGLIACTAWRLIALYGMACLIACAVIAISAVVAAWLAALMVGVALVAAAGVAALLGIGRPQKATPPVPEEAAASIKTDVEVVKYSVGGDRIWTGRRP